MNDPHKELASKMFGVPVEAVTDEQRQKAKMASMLEHYHQPPLQEFQAFSAGKVSVDEFRKLAAKPVYMDLSESAPHVQVKTVSQGAHPLSLHAFQAVQSFEELFGKIK